MDYWGRGGGGKGYVGPPLKLLGGAWPPGPPSSYAYVITVRLPRMEPLLCFLVSVVFDIVHCDLLFVLLCTVRIFNLCIFDLSLALS